MHLPNPVIRSHSRNGFIKQYLRDHLMLCTEGATNNVTDYGVNKAVEHLPALRDKLSAINDNYLDIQQYILRRLSIAGISKSSPNPSSPRPQTHSRPQARQPPAIGRDAGVGTLRRSRRPTPSAPVKSICDCRPGLHH
jgi:hypothetical protein